MTFVDFHRGKLMEILKAYGVVDAVNICTPIQQRKFCPLTKILNSLKFYLEFSREILWHLIYSLLHWITP